MALKFLNKKGWHTGSLRNIENVWKAEQKHDAEQKKLEELRKQIHEERERSEFRLLQEQAGLVPKQERLDFLYDSGLAVGKGNSDGFKALESFPPKADPGIPSSSNKQQQSSAPGALFEDKPQSANDAWRKLHSDPLLLIRQREQEALARVKNNPIQMAMIRKSVEAKKHKEKTSDGEKNHHHKKSKHKKKHTSSKNFLDSGNVKETGEQSNITFSRSSKFKNGANSEEESGQSDFERKRKSDKNLKHKKDSLGALSYSSHKNVPTGSARNNDRYRWQRDDVEHLMDSEFSRKAAEDGRYCPSTPHEVSDTAAGVDAPHKRPNRTMKLSKEERDAKLHEMQMDAELHEEQRWKRLRLADEDDAKEAIRSRMSGGRNFLDAAHKSVFGAEKGGSSTIEESVRRRTHYSQRRSEENAFRR